MNNGEQQVNTMNDNLIRTNLILTKKLRKAFQEEANRHYGGVMSKLFQAMLCTRYDMPKEIAPEFHHYLERERKVLKSI